MGRRPLTLEDVRNSAGNFRIAGAVGGPAPGSADLRPMRTCFTNENGINELIEIRCAEPGPGN